MCQAHSAGLVMAPVWNTHETGEARCHGPPCVGAGGRTQRHGRACVSGCNSLLVCGVSCVQHTEYWAGGVCAKLYTARHCSVGLVYSVSWLSCPSVEAPADAVDSLLHMIDH
jgi:hypothetical protein